MDDWIIPLLNQNPHHHWIQGLVLVPQLQKISTKKNTSSGQKLTRHDRFLGTRALSVCKFSLTALQELDLLLLLTLAHWLILFLGWGLCQFTRGIARLELLSHLFVNLRGMYHDQAVDFPESRNADDVNVKLKCSIVADL